jgi:hypothetical protein
VCGYPFNNGTSADWAGSSNVRPIHLLHEAHTGTRNAGGRLPLYGRPYAVPTYGPPGCFSAYLRIQLGNASSRSRGPLLPQRGHVQDVRCVLEVTTGHRKD